MATTLTLDDIKKLATLANIPLTAIDPIKISSELSAVLQLVNSLQKIDTTHVMPTSQVTGLTNVYREDNVKSSLTQTQALSNASRQHNGYFVVDAIFD